MNKKFSNEKKDFPHGIDFREVHCGLMAGSILSEMVASLYKASAVGCNWNNTNASPRTVNCNNSVSNGNNYFVGVSAFPRYSLNFSLRAKNHANKAKQDWTTGRERSAGLLDFGNEDPQILFGGTHESVISKENLKPLFIDDGVIRQGIINASQGTKDKRAVKKFMKRIDFNVQLVKKVLDNETYEVGPYRDLDIVTGGKVRTISILPFFDKCVQHIVKIVIEPYLMSYITRDAYSCLPGRGLTSSNKTYNLINQMQKAINTNRKGTAYHLEMDVHKFYPSMTTEVCLASLFRVITCPYTRRLLCKIASAYPTLPIGDPISQLIMNVVMSDLDHALREKKHVKYYYRYTDNMWIFSGDKALLHALRSWVSSYIAGRYNLELKDNYQVRNTDKEGVNACGYRIFPGYVLIRKKTKQNYIKSRHKPASLASYNGLLQHCNSINLRHIIEDMNNKKSDDGRLIREFVGKKVNFTDLVGQKIAIVDFEKRESTKKKGTFFYQLQIIRKDDKDQQIIESTTTGADAVCDYLDSKTEADLPLIETVRKDTRGIYFEGTIVSDEEIKNQYINKFNINL